MGANKSTAAGKAKGPPPSMNIEDGPFPDLKKQLSQQVQVTTTFEDLDSLPDQGPDDNPIKRIASHYENVGEDLPSEEVLDDPKDFLEQYVKGTFFKPKTIEVMWVRKDEPAKELDSGIQKYLMGLIDEDVKDTTIKHVTRNQKTKAESNQAHAKQFIESLSPRRKQKKNQHKRNLSGMIERIEDVFKNNNKRDTSCVSTINKMKLWNHIDSNVWFGYCEEQNLEITLEYLPENGKFKIKIQQNGKGILNYFGNAAQIIEKAAVEKFQILDAQKLLQMSLRQFTAKKGWFVFKQNAYHKKIQEEKKKHIDRLKVAECDAKDENRTLDKETLTHE